MFKGSFKTKVLWLKMNEAYDNLQFLVKYAPKYYTKVDFDVSDLSKAKVLQKTRATKIIRAAGIHSYNNNKQGILMRALKMKEKYIKQIEGVKVDTVKKFSCINKLVLCLQDYFSWRAFFHLIHLETLTLETYSLSTGSPLFQNQKLTRYLDWRFWKHASDKFKKIKFVYCHFYNQLGPELEKFLMKLSGKQNFLSSLSSLMLHFNYIGNPVSKELDLNQLYKFTKSLKVHECSSKTLQYFLEGLNQFQNLQDLSILKAVEEIHRAESMDLCSLSNLENLKKLENLEVSLNLNLTHNLKSFLEYFTLPASIVNIKLNFHEVGLKKLLNDENVELSQEVFENNALHVKFCKTWKNLNNLNSLSLSFIEVENESPLWELYFVTPILRQLSTLSSLYYARWCDSESENKEVVDFNYFWDSISHLKASLKVLYMETAAISLDNFPLTRTEESGYALKVIGLCGNVAGDSKVQNITRLLDIKPSQTEQKAQLEIESLVIDSKESFEGFLRGFSNVPRDVILTLNCNMSKISGRDFVNTLSKFASKIPRRRQIKISFCNVPKIKESFLKRLLEGLEVCGILDYIKISDQRGRMLYAGTNWYENFQESSFFPAATTIIRSEPPEQSSNEASNSTLKSCINDDSNSSSETGGIRDIDYQFHHEY